MSGRPRGLQGVIDQTDVLASAADDSDTPGSARRRSPHDHWLAAVNALAALFVVLPFVAPILSAVGLSGPANLIYAAYRSVCHQWAFRSYFLFGSQTTYSLEELGTLVGPERTFAFLGNPELGYKVAFCERDVAIYLSALLAGLAYAALRPRAGALSPSAYLLLLAPIALDGFTQLVGLRESTVLLRTLTGALFGLASVWFIYPRIDQALRSLPAGSLTRDTVPIRHPERGAG